MREVEYQQSYSHWIRQGIEAVEEGNVALALGLFENVREEDLSPLAKSYMAYCLARERRQGSKAINIALHAIKKEQTHPLIYLNLGRVYLALGRDKKALQIYRKGLKYQQHPLLIRHIEALCSRQGCTFPFLKRSNPLNIIFGRMRAKLFFSF